MYQLAQTHIFKMLDFALAVLSGVLAASSAAWGKAVRNGYVNTMMLDKIFPENVIAVLQYGIFLLINVFMWLTFVSALKKSSRVVVVIALNYICNLLSTVGVFISFSFITLGNLWINCLQ